MDKKHLSTAEVLQKYNDIWNQPLTEKTKIPFIPFETVKYICRKSIKILNTQSLYLEVGCPLTIVGDIHGSLNDLFRILRLFKIPPKANYLFLGDYVDRGTNSVAVIILLLALFCEFPVEVTLLRGNHEFPSINKNYGFYDEIMKLYNDASLWELFNEVFSYLPLVAVVNDKIFCVHGGISPKIKTLREIKAIPMPFKGFDVFPPVADLVWSDPSDKTQLFEKNIRGTGYIYGTQAISNFLQTNNLKLMIRAHQCTLKGVHSFSDEIGVTIFSCSNYGSVCNNRCGVCRVCGNDKLYFYSLGPDTEMSAYASATMILGDKIGMQLPQPKETPPSPTKKIVQTKMKRSESPRPKRSLMKPKQNSPINQKEDLIQSDTEIVDHPSIKFLREDSLPGVSENPFQLKLEQSRSEPVLNVGAKKSEKHAATVDVDCEKGEEGDAKAPKTKKKRRRHKSNAVKINPSDLIIPKIPKRKLTRIRKKREKDNDHVDE